MARWDMKSGKRELERRNLQRVIEVGGAIKSEVKRKRRVIMPKVAVPMEVPG